MGASPCAISRRQRSPQARQRHPGKAGHQSGGGLPPLPVSHSRQKVQMVTRRQSRVAPRGPEAAVGAEAVPGGGERPQQQKRTLQRMMGLQSRWEQMVGRKGCLEAKVGREEVQRAQKGARTRAGAQERAKVRILMTQKRFCRSRKLKVISCRRQVAKQHPRSSRGNERVIWSMRIRLPWQCRCELGRFACHHKFLTLIALPRCMDSSDLQATIARGEHSA